MSEKSTESSQDASESIPLNSTFLAGIREVAAMQKNTARSVGEVIEAIYKEWPNRGGSAEAGKSLFTGDAAFLLRLALFSHKIQEANSFLDSMPVQISGEDIRGLRMLENALVADFEEVMKNFRVSRFDEILPLFAEEVGNFLKWLEARKAKRAEYYRQSRVQVEMLEMMNYAERAGESAVDTTIVVLYLDDESTSDAVLRELEKTLAAFDCEIIGTSNEVTGSIWKAFLAVFTRQTAEERLEQAGDTFTAGAKARWYGEPQSQITKAQGEAISGLLSSLEGNENALVAFSNILIIKIDGVPLVRELTPEQVEHLQKTPACMLTRASHSAFSTQGSPTFKQAATKKTSEPLLPSVIQAEWGSHGIHAHQWLESYSWRY